MTVTLRPWAGWDDLEGMRDVLSHDLRVDPGGSSAHPGDVSWWVGWPPKDHASLASTVRIWVEDGTIRGWAMIDEGDVGEFVRPAVVDDRSFFVAVDAWIDEVEAGDGALVRYADEGDGRADRRLRASGWQPRPDEGLQTFEFDLTAVGGPRDPRVHVVRDDDRLVGRLAITHAAFGVVRPFDRYVAEYRTFMASPAYPSGWDLVAWDGDRAVACAIVWPDEISGVGNVEPVATHPEAVRRGFGRAVVLEGLRRLRDAGMHTAIVRTGLTNAGAVAFYQEVGFRPTTILRGYTRAGASDLDG